MKFEIKSSWYMDEELLDEYPCLTKYGYEVVDVERDSLRAIRDENGKIMMQKVGTYTLTRRYVSINTLEELDAFNKDVDCPIIVDTRDLSIEIYD